MWPPRLRTLSRCAVGSAKCMMELQDQIKAPLARSLARSFSSVLSSVSRPTTHSLPSCCFVLHCGCCCPCPLRPSSSAAVAAAAAFVWPPTVPPSPPCRRRPRRTTVSLARSLARSVDVGSAATATVTVVEIIVGEREREGWRAAAARGQRRPAFPPERFRSRSGRPFALAAATNTNKK